jgi:hypothetical protein
MSNKNVVIKPKLAHYAPWRSLEERKYSSYWFLTSTMDGGVVSVTPRPRFTPGKGPSVSIGQEAGWSPEPVWTQARGKSLLPLPGIEPRSPGRPVRSQTLHWLSYPAPKNSIIWIRYIELAQCCVACLAIRSHSSKYLMVSARFLNSLWLRVGTSTQLAQSVPGGSSIFIRLSNASRQVTSFS